MIRGAIFDVDGTLLDSMHVWDTVASDYVKANNLVPADDLDSRIRECCLRDVSIIMKRLAPEYGIEEKSVRKMSAIILKKRVSKSQQLSNWESSHLSEAQLRYAAIDAWICREMYYKLKESNSNG